MTMMTDPIADMLTSCKKRKHGASREIIRITCAQH